jgi:hypothetical protein
VTREPQYDDATHLKVDFTPVAPGPLTFTATWTQLTQPGGSPCTASASATVTATAPTPARAARQLSYVVDHRPGKTGRNTIRVVMRAVRSMRRPPAGTPAIDLTLDPLNIPRGGARASSPLVRGLLRSPAHGLVSGHLALLTVTGRRSGRTFTFPVGYRQEGERVIIGVQWPERKRWWRNLVDGGRVELRLAGVRRSATAWARGDAQSGVTVEVELDGVASS